jgi:division protein CdvB (Snf7/Vps24/ESCRT-III family)
MTQAEINAEREIDRLNAEIERLEELRDAAQEVLSRAKAARLLAAATRWREAGVACD